MTRPRVPFNALSPGEDGPAIRQAIDRVVAGGRFILGPEVEAFETEFAAAMGAACAVGVGSGTDAIALVLRALGIGSGDEVITSPLSAAYSALAVLMTGARPVFADIDPERLTIEPSAVEAAIGPRTRAVLPVHVYGQPADTTAIERIASRHHLAIVEDCCQAHLATENGRPVGTVGVAGAFSFYPTKNLGALGDGGAVITSDRTLAERVKRLRNGGQSDRYHHVEPGVNSRLDELQAAILRSRLPLLRKWTMRRRELAGRYRAALAGADVSVPPERDAGHVYHLFVVRARSAEARRELRKQLTAEGIETLIHYPVSIPRQPALAATKPAECPVATGTCDKIFSLPLYPTLTDEQVDTVAAAVREKDTTRCER